MTEREMLGIIQAERRKVGLRPITLHSSEEGLALMRALTRIAERSEQDQRMAARAASTVGFAVTRGRTTF